jgi:hypothetical protein
VSRKDDLDDCEECWERSSSECGAQDRRSALLCPSLEPDAEGDQCWWKEPAARTEPGGEDVAQRISKKSTTREDQANREYHTRYGEGEEDERARGGATHSA